MPAETLFDQFLYRRDHFPWDVSESRMALANRFVLDSEASSLVGEMIRKVGYEILSNHEFARPPYDVTWVELDHIAYYKELTGLDGDGAEDEMGGFLFDHGSVHCVSSSKKRGVGTYPISFRLDQRVSLEEELELAQRVETSRLMLRRMIVGDTGVIDKPGGQDLVNEVATSHRTIVEIDELSGPTLNQVMSSGAGTLKMAIALLLLLTRPGKTVITLESAPHRSGVHRGKRVVYHSYNRVKLRLDRTKALERVKSHLEMGMTRRRHEVRGHWCQSHQRGIGCTHVWDAFDPDHFKCVKCGTSRWWRKHHARGDSTKGWVQKDYEVTR